MLPKADLATRCAVAALLLIALFAIRWDTSLQHFDWQVWEASGVLLDEGIDPYDADQLNLELQSNPDAYGPHFNENRRMYLLNPPSWIVTIRGMGSSPLVMSLLGGVAFFGSIVALTRERSNPDVVAHLAAAAVFIYLGPGVSTFRFGQTGLWLAGLVGVSLVIGDRRALGVPIALVSSKPHLAFGLGVARLARRPLFTAVAIAVPLAALAALTTGWLGGGPWTDWIDQLRSGGAHPTLTIGEMSIRTLSEHLPFVHIGALGVPLGIIAASALAYHCRTRDVRVTTLATLAVMTYLSGHAFAHDWMWFPLVPIVLGWPALRSVLATLSVGAVVTGWFDVDLGAVVINPLSAMFLVVTVVLVRAAMTRPEPDAERQSSTADDDRTAADQAKLSANASS